MQSKDLPVRKPKLLRSPVQKGNFNSRSKLLNLVNSLENCRKFRKNANSILLDPLWKIQQLLLYSHSLILDIFSMKNMNVKNLDLP
jgi:hypothetical protein